jgi:hypothetical protein
MLPTLLTTFVIFSSSALGLITASSVLTASPDISPTNRLLIPYIRTIGELQSPVTPPSQKPAPHDIQAQDVALDVEDMPAGFTLKELTSLELTDTMREAGVVSLYRTAFIRDAEVALLEDLVGVQSIVYVFWTEDDARLRFQLTLEDLAAELESLADTLEVTILSSAVYGDESVAIVATNGANGREYEAFYILFRKGNVAATVSIEGWAEATSLNELVPYVERMLAKIENAN